MNPRLIAVGGCAECFVAAAIVGVLLAATLAPVFLPRQGPAWRRVAEHVLVLALIWLALAAILDLNHVIHDPY